jgi:hypothetical protein
MKVTIYISFAIFALNGAIGNLVLANWLRKKGVRFLPGFSGTPVYVEYVYYRWCRQQNRSSTPILIYRTISIIGAIIATIVFIKSIVPK